MITLAALGLVLRAPPPRLLAEISEEKLELSVTPTRKLWLAEGSRWPGSQQCSQCLRVVQVHPQPCRLL